MEPTNLPWSDPNSDPMADIGDYMRRQYENYRPTFLEPIHPESPLWGVFKEWDKENEAD